MQRYRSSVLGKSLYGARYQGTTQVLSDHLLTPFLIARHHNIYYACTMSGEPSTSNPLLRKRLYAGLEIQS
jgi:hypothetical protein